MFLDKTINDNSELINVSMNLHQKGLILPDTFIIDVDQFLQNAKGMLEEAQKYDIDLYFMLKQVGRNPYLAKKLIELGYKGAVVVDFREALVMIEHNIPIMNVGNLVQVPTALLEKIIKYKPEYITVFSFDTVKRINEIAEKLTIRQKIMIRVIDKNDKIYSGQEAGIELDHLHDFINQCNVLKNVECSGVTSFPCFLYDSEANDIVSLPNLNTILEAKKIMEKLGIDFVNVNAPSSTCKHILPLLKRKNVTSAEPGHGLSGTTPAHNSMNLYEKPCVVYLSEVSHHYNGLDFCYGGGHYRRSHVRNALVGGSLRTSDRVKVIAPSDENIDYYFALEGENHKIGSSVVMAFRFQMFITRSDIVLIKGLKNKEPKIIGVFDSQGREK